MVEEVGGGGGVGEGGEGEVGEVEDGVGGENVAVKKTCCNCKKELPGTLEFFSKNSSGKNDGLHYRCRPCVREYHKERNKNKSKEPKPVETHRACIDCAQSFPLTDEFFQKRNKGRSHLCRLCWSKQVKARREEGWKDGRKPCSKCKQELPATPDFFYGTPKGVLSSECRECKSAYNKEWWRSQGREKHQADPLRYKEASRKFHKENREEQNARARENHRAVREEALTAYGYKCDCCGETRFEFLGIDHILEDGHEHRKSGLGGNIYFWLRRQGFPKDGRFRILCNNCNMAIAHYGGCPHKGAVPNRSLVLRLNEKRRRNEARVEEEQEETSAG